VWGIACVGCLLFLVARVAHADITYGVDARMITPADQAAIGNPVTFSSNHGFHIRGALPFQQLTIDQYTHEFRDGQNDAHTHDRFNRVVTCDGLGWWDDSWDESSSPYTLGLGNHDCHAETSIVVGGQTKAGISSTLNHFTVVN